jgi:IS4 transposase
MHTLLDLRGRIPAYVCITDGKVADVRILDELVPEPGSIYVMDRGYIDFARLHRLQQARAIFVTRAKRNMRWHRQYSRAVDRSTGLLCDQTIVLDHPETAETYPDKLRRIRYRDPDTGQLYTYLTNDFALDALTVARLYKARWEIEIFFKWIKQHLRIQNFYGRSPNAVKTQIWIAISVYLIVAIARKRLGIERDLYTLLQILSVSLFEKVPLQQALSGVDYTVDSGDTRNQLQLFDL